MAFPRKLALLLLTAFLCSCAAGPDTRNLSANGEAKPDIETLQQMLPGAYSNFAQVHDQQPDVPVTDISIRQLKTIGDPVFLFEQKLRGQATSSFDLYWLRRNRQTGLAEFHFTHLAEGELSLPMQEVLSIAWQRVLPGCAIPLNRDGINFSGQTDPANCVFEHPLQGEIRLKRGFSIGRDGMTIKTATQGIGNQNSNEETLLELQKHRGFKARASLHDESGQPQGAAEVWQMSQDFNIRDDGRVNDLYGQDMTPMGFGLQLARLYRVDGEPPQYLLSVINRENGQTQAYQWFKQDSKFLNLEFDWFQASLEAIEQEIPLP